MTIEMTTTEYLNMEKQVLDLPVKSFVRLLNKLVFTSSYPIYKYTDDNINKAFKTPAEAISKLKDAPIGKNDYFWVDANDAVYFIKETFNVLKVLHVLSIDLNLVVNLLQSNPDVAEEHGLKVIYISECHVHDYLDNNLHLIPVETLVKFLKDEVIKNDLIPDIEVIERNDGTFRVWAKETTLS